jgi:hypothetical protein
MIQIANAIVPNYSLQIRHSEGERNGINTRVHDLTEVRPSLAAVG